MILWKKQEGITTKLKRSIRRKEPKVKTQTDEERKVLIAEKKKERERKKDWIAALVEEVVKERIKGEEGSW